MRIGVLWWMLKACERLDFMTPARFWSLPREEQVLLVTYALERDLEEQERPGNLTW